MSYRDPREPDAVYRQEHIRREEIHARAVVVALRSLEVDDYVVWIDIPPVALAHRIVNLAQGRALEDAP